MLLADPKYSPGIIREVSTLWSPETVEYPSTMADFQVEDPNERTCRFSLLKLYWPFSLYVVIDTNLRTLE